MKRRIGLLGYLGLLAPITAQHYHQPFLQEDRLHLERSLSRRGMDVHTSIKPYRVSELKKVADPDSVLGVRQWNNRFSRTWVGRKLLNEDLVQVYVPGFDFQLNPVIDFNTGRDFASEDEQRLWTNTRGFTLRGNFGKKFSFYSDFYENQALFPGYINDISNSLAIVPGMGRSKPFKDAGAIDWAWANAYVVYQPIEQISLEFGQGRNFFGDGYRSLLLSDAAFNYPYFKISTEIWKIRYTNLFAEFQDITPSMAGDNLNWKKYGAFHYLDISIVPGLNLGLFEGVIFSGRDSTGLNRGFEVSYLNPVIFYRPIEYGLGSYDKVMIGANLRWRITPSHQLYGQVLIDEFNLSAVLGNPQPGWRANKQGFQVGYKYFDVFGLEGLHFQTEFNYVPPYTYAHWRVNQGYGHYNQPLAHPLGANFAEILGFLNYRRNRITAQARYSFAVSGQDRGDGISWGGNVFAMDTNHPYEYQNVVGQGNRTTIAVLEASTAYIINPRYGLRFETGLRVRQAANESGVNTHTWFWIGLRTNLPNRYFDW